MAITRAQLLAMVMVVASGHASPRPPRTVAEDAALVTAIADEYVRALAAMYPEQADEVDPGGGRHDRFSDRSPARIASWARTVRALYARVEGLDGERLFGRPEWITLGVLREALERDRGLRICRRELWAVDYFFGWQTKLADLAKAQTVGTPERRRVAIARWKTLPRFIDVEIANLREELRLRFSSPRLVVERTIAQPDRLLALPLVESPRYDPARRDAELATAMPGDVSCTSMSLRIPRRRG